MIFFTLEHILTHISFLIVSIVITIHLITLLVNEIIGLYDSSEKGLLVTHWIYLGHFSLSDFFSIIHIFPYFKKHKNHLSPLTAPSAIFTQGFATSSLLIEMHQSEILVPALQSQLLMMHVSMMVLGYAALLYGSLLSVTLLVITFRQDIRILCKNNFFLNKSFSFDEIQYMNKGNNILQNTSFLSAFITWTILAIYLHTRTNKNLQVANSAIVTSMGFLIIWICYFGVNLLGIGLHSYGSFTFSSNL
ncbi:hypothetical protein AAG906_004589 [Vitis piasezkii]